MDELSNVKAVIFDLDGTLIDTEKIYRKVWPIATAKLGYEMKDEHYLAMRSLGRPFAPLKMREWFGPDFDYNEARKIRKTYFDEYIANNGIERKKGAIELLKYLKDKKITTAIATATDLTRAAQYMEMAGINGYFDKVISAADAKEGKPSPDVYINACKVLGLEPSDCLAVEDAPNGIISAYKAGLKVIMVPDQSGLEDYLEPMIYACVDSLDKICEFI